MTEKDSNEGTTNTDPASLLFLGGFMMAIAFPLLVWTAFSSTMRVMLINGIGGIVLLATGIGFILRGRSLRKRRE